MLPLLRDKAKDPSKTFLSDGTALAMCGFRAAATDPFTKTTERPTCRIGCTAWLVATMEVLWAHMHETDRALVQEAFAT